MKRGARDQFLGSRRGRRRCNGDCRGRSQRGGVIFLLKRGHRAGLNLNRALAGLEPDYRSVSRMAIGVDAKAVGQHDEFAGLRHERNRNKTQQQLYRPKSHSTILTHFEAHAWKANPKWPIHREESDGFWAALRAVPECRKAPGAL